MSNAENNQRGFQATMEQPAKKDWHVAQKSTVVVDPAVVCASSSFQVKAAPKDPGPPVPKRKRKANAEVNPQVSPQVSPSPIEKALQKTSLVAESGGGTRKRTRSKKKKAQPSRSKAAVRDARAKAKKFERMVEEGLCKPPKRNKPFRLNVKKLGMRKLGPFWYSLDPKSCYYMSYEDYQVLKEILSFFDDATNLEKFHRARSGCDLRYYLNFHILHCKQSRVLGTVDPFMTDFANDYLANQRRYTRKWFDEFNRGPRMLVFEAPQYILDELAKKEAAYSDSDSDSEDEDDGDGDDGPPSPVMLCVAVRQLNYFHWIFTTGKFEIMCEREPKLHPTMNEYVKGHKERKSRLHLTTRQKLCAAAPGPVIVDHTDTFTMRL